MDKWTETVITDLMKCFKERLYWPEYILGIVIGISDDGTLQTFTSITVPDLRTPTDGDLLKRPDRSAQPPLAVLQTDLDTVPSESWWLDEFCLSTDTPPVSLIDNLLQTELGRRHTLFRQVCPICDRRQRNNQLRRVLNTQDCRHELYM